MSIEEILKEVAEIFVDVLDNEDIQLSMDTTANDIEEWDSLSHIMLIVAIEKHFKIKFSSVEINGFKNVGELCKTVEAKLN
ncbi:MAG: acyl carrier protein [Crocinitomicaceae bacterium]|jgi:acyl carrier protein|nr:acyl carrier protein [Crocinitomicaceae bacterium]